MFIHTFLLISWLFCINKHVNPKGFQSTFAIHHFMHPCVRLVDLIPGMTSLVSDRLCFKQS